MAESLQPSDAVPHEQQEINGEEAQINPPQIGYLRLASHMFVTVTPDFAAYASDITQQIGEGIGKFLRRGHTRPEKSTLQE